MSDAQVADLQRQVGQLTAALDEQADSKNRAYEDLGDRERQVNELEREVVSINVQLAHESARAAALDLEADLYRDRYHRALQRINTVSLDVGIANAARNYLASIERRGSLEDDVVVALVHLADRIRRAPDQSRDPQHDLVIELEAELEALRIRIAELIDQRDAISGQRDDLEGQAADWQEFAETSDRELVKAQKKIITLEQWPSEARHALGHVVDCDDNCRMCRDLAADALERTFGAH